MIKLILYIYVYTIRNFISWWYNRKFHKKILNSRYFRNLIVDAYLIMATSDSVEDLINSYYEIYRGYAPDVGMDWTPSFHTMLYKEKDDCDGMAVVGKYILKEFCRIKSLEYKYINIYSFIHIRSFTKAHAMTVLKVKSNSYYLFDYGKFIHFKNKNSLKKYYTNYYLHEKINAKKIYMIEIPEPHGIKKFEKKSTLEYQYHGI